MTLTALNDLDRTTDGIATGNVLSGALTQTGTAGKDSGGVAPVAVGLVQYGMTFTAVSVGGADIAGQYGTLHINPDGSYTYTRIAANLWDAGAPGVSAEEVFTYWTTDKNGAVAAAHLNIELQPQVALSENKATHVVSGTGFDDFIVVADHSKTYDGGAGADRIVGGSGRQSAGSAGCRRYRP